MRYRNDSIIKTGTSLASNEAAIRLRTAFNAGNLTTRTLVTGASTRLDHVAFKYLGDASFWWAIAALSGIGWGMQLAPNTRLVIPTNVSQIASVI